MEIFNAVSKQMDTSAATKTAPTMETRQVEQAEVQREVAKDSKTQNAQDKKEIQQQLSQSVKKLNQQMDALNTNIEFGFNDKISSMYVNVMEKDSGKVIRKLPTEEAMKLAEHFKEIIGMIFDQKG